MADKVAETRMMKELVEWSRDRPEWMKEARRFLDLWGDEHALSVVMAMAMQEAYSKGEQGRPIHTVTARVGRTRQRKEVEDDSPPQARKAAPTTRARVRRSGAPKR